MTPHRSWYPIIVQQNNLFVLEGKSFRYVIQTESFVSVIEALYIVTLATLY